MKSSVTWNPGDVRLPTGASQPAELSFISQVLTALSPNLAAAALLVRAVPSQLVAVGFANAPVATQPRLATISTGASKLA